MSERDGQLKIFSVGQFQAFDQFDLRDKMFDKGNTNTVQLTLC